jgi:hypothetical protein
VFGGWHARDCTLILTVSSKLARIEEHVQHLSLKPWFQLFALNFLVFFSGLGKLG